MVGNSPLTSTGPGLAIWRQRIRRTTIWACSWIIEPGASPSWGGSAGVPCGSSQAYGDQCEACGNPIEPLKLKNPRSVITGTTPIPRRRVHWYLLLGRLEEPIRAWLREKGQERGGSPAWPEGTLGFALGQLAQGLPARAMTRDLSWGVPVPLSDPDARRPAAMLGLPEALFWEEATRELPENDPLGTLQVLFPKLAPKEVLGHLGFGEP